MKSLDSHDLAYLAGLMDGEGSIGIRKVIDPRMLNFRYHIFIAVVNCDKPVLEEFKNKTEIGCIYTRKSIKGFTNRPVHQWQISSNQAASLLEVLLPYLRIKRQQAILCIDFSHHLDECCRKPLTDEELATREMYKMAISALSQKGTLEGAFEGTEKPKEGGIN